MDSFLSQRFQDGDREAMVRVNDRGVLFYGFEREGPFLRFTQTYEEYLELPGAGVPPKLHKRIVKAIKKGRKRRRTEEPLAPPVQRWWREDVEDHLKNGWSVDNPDVEGKTALQWAIRRKELDLVPRLIAAGADVNLVTDEFTETPLHFACRGGDLDTIEQLLDAGANLEAVDMDFKGCFHFTVGPPGAPRDTRLAVVRRLLALGLDPDGNPSCEHRTPLMEAARLSGVEVIEALIDGRANIELVNGFGTALMVAEARLDAVEALLRRGAQPDTVDQQGRSALWHAVSRGLRNIKREGPLIRLLVRAGADASLADRKGVSPRMLATGGKDGSASDLPAQTPDSDDALEELVRALSGWT